jgi:hypothetical protein
MNKVININEELTKSEIKDLVKDVLEKELKNKIKDAKLTDEEKVRSIIKDLLKKHYKTLWTKSIYFIEDL